jgi:hypothetical protein
MAYLELLAKAEEYEDEEECPEGTCYICTERAMEKKFMVEGPFDNLADALMFAKWEVSAPCFVGNDLCVYVLKTEED